MITDMILIPATVAVPAGSFAMGESPFDKFANDTERPSHLVAFAKPFALGQSPVTVAEYRVFAPRHGPDHSPRLPVVNVSWLDARAYCAWLTSETEDCYRLPTEAEWEYACRAGTTTCFATGDELAIHEANYLYSEEGQRVGIGKRTPVGHYPANAFGLFDLHGNVCEWVEDAWSADYRGASDDGRARTVDRAPVDRENRHVLRGGAWDYLPRLLRSSWRDALPAEHHRDNLGFRVARDLAS